MENGNNSKQVVIGMEGSKSPTGYNKIKFSKMPSINEQYQRKMSTKELVYSDDLMEVIAKGDVTTCGELLKDFKFVDIDTNYFFHPLLLAAKKDRYEILLLLLDMGVDINAQDKKNFTAFHYALQQRSVRCCIALLERNIKVDVADKFGNVALHLAASEGLTEIVELLLEKIEDPNIKNKKDQTALHFAAMKGHSEIVNVLLEKGVRWDLKDINFWLPLHFAAFHGQHNCCRILVEASGERMEEHLDSRNKDNATPLILAAKKGHSRCCLELKDSDINAHDNKGNTPLHLAATVGFLKTVNILLTMNADVSIPNKDGNTPVHKAALQKQLDCLKVLLDHCSEVPGPNDSKQTLIHLATLSNCTDSLKYLTENCSTLPMLNAQDKNGKSALHIALNLGFSDCAQILLEAGADCTLLDEKGNYPLHVAAGAGLLNICKLLLSGTRVGFVNERNFSGTTPLHFAAMNGCVNCCKILLTKGADLSVLDSSGFSPLHVAAHLGNLDVIKLFTKKSGGYINQVVEISGDTTLHLAARNGFYDSCEFILRNIKKDYIIKLNNKENSVLDDAFNYGHDEIFRLVLSKVPIPNQNEKYKIEQYYSFQLSLHEYMHVALQSKREMLIKAIVDSDWWYSGFSSSFCEEGQCPNLTRLTALNCLLTELVYSKGIAVKENSILYNFRLFEDSHFVPVENLNTSIKRDSPFDPLTGKLKKEAMLYPKQGKHPLLVAAEMEHLNLMTHELSEAYLNYKWSTYMFIIMSFIVLSEVILVVLLGLYLNYSLNYNQLSNLNVTKEHICSGNFTINSEADVIIQKRWLPSLIVYFILVITVIGLLITEINISRKTKSSFFNIIKAIRVYRLIGTFLLILPLNLCIYDISIKETWQWQVGILTLLLSWFHMIHEINAIPPLSVFMPVTQRFFQSFFKVIFYIILIVFVFAFIFHLLLRGTPAFNTIPGSFVKTTVWVLGDLGYDEVFVDKKNILLYPVMTTAIFLLLVTSISGFVVNLIITQPSDYASVFREKAFTYKASSRIQLFLKLDTIFDIVKKRFLVGFYVISRPSVLNSSDTMTTLVPPESPRSQTSKGDKENTTNSMESKSKFGENSNDDKILVSILQKLENLEAKIVELSKN